MQIHPNRSAVDLTVGGVLVLILGLAMSQPLVVAWAGAILIGLQVARSVTLLSVRRVRTAGFEMVWSEAQRVRKLALGQRLELKAEVRNRDSRAARYAHLRALHSPLLEVHLEPTEGEVPAEGRLSVNVHIRPKRVGRHGLFGLSLEVQGSPGLYEVPLTFSSPFGVEVLPQGYQTTVRAPRGGRSRHQAHAGRQARRSGGNQQLRELRDYMFGDPFKRIAWKASGRRGKLVTREYDQEERDCVWVMLDASSELWAGTPGLAPLDIAINRTAALIEQHLGQGDSVGLGIIARRRLAWLRPSLGVAHAARLIEALATETATLDADRAGLDEDEVTRQVLEHLRPLTGDTSPLNASQPERIASRAAEALSRAPFSAPLPRGHSVRERQLRQYVAAFGIHTPPQLQAERQWTDAELLLALKDALTDRPRPSIVYICGPAPAEDRKDLCDGIRRLPRKSTELRWLPISTASGLNVPNNSQARAVAGAVAARANAEQGAAHRQLRAARVRIENLPLKQSPKRQRAPSWNGSSI